MTTMLEHVRLIVSERQTLSREVKEMLVERLGLDVDPTHIGDDQPLFGRGLELDSIDTLELAMAVEDQYDVIVTDDDTTTLLSLNRLVDHIVARRS